MRKIKVLLIANVSPWILGDIGKNIFKTLSSEFDIFFITEPLLHRRKDFAQKLINEVDIVHSICESATIILYNSFDISNKPIITWVHHITTLSKAHKISFNISDYIIASNRPWADEILKQGASAEKVKIIKYGVDIHKFRPFDSSYKGLFNIPDSSFVLGFVASRNSDADGNRKGVDVLISLLIRLKTRINNMHIVFAGPGWDDIVKQLTKLGISANTIGYIRKDLPKLYASLDVYLMTSRVEGGPCTVLESMASGVPVVATQVGLVFDSIIDGETGFSSMVNDIDNLEKDILNLYASKKLRSEIGRKAREKAVNELQWDHTLINLRDVYTSIKNKTTISDHQTNYNTSQLIKTICAADSILIVLSQLKRRQIGIIQGYKLLREFLFEVNFFDIMRGVFFLSGLTYK